MITASLKTLEDIESYIIEQSQLYYSTGKNECTDDEFDDLLEYLKNGKPNSVIFTSTGWGYDPLKNIGKKEKHLYMKIEGISKKIKNVADIPKSMQHKKVTISAKLDGLSIVLYYKQGKLTHALTRGNGEIGINKTDKVLKILEREIQYPTDFDFTGAIRGEFVISNENWKIMQDKNIAGISQRNTVAGIINKDEIDTMLQYVDIVFYKVVFIDKNINSMYNDVYKQISYEQQKSDFEFLKQFVLKEYLAEYNEVDLNEELNHIDTFELAVGAIYTIFNRKYQCDGLVITTLDKNISNDEHIEIAFKFVNETAIAIVKDIKWELSKASKLIPVIQLEPIELSGAVIQNVSGFNAKYILENKIKKDTQLKIVRSGEVIPYILEVKINDIWKVVSK